MANCRDCNAFVVFLKKPEGGFFPPFDPVSDVDLTEFFVSNESGTAAAAPQLFRKHRCVSAEEKLSIQQAREAERQRLIQEDRERRRIARETAEALEAARLEREQQQEEDKRALEEAAAEALHEEFAEKPNLTLVATDVATVDYGYDFGDRDPDDESTKILIDFRRRALRDLYRTEAQRQAHWQFGGNAARLRALPCPNCGAHADKPCWRSEQPSEIELLGQSLAIRLGKLEEPGRRRVYVSEPRWFADRPCPERWAAAPAAPRILPRREYFAEDDHPTWPPEFPQGTETGTGYLMAPLTPEQVHAGAGRYEMAEFLANNVDLFNIGSDASPDSFRKSRNFLTVAEVTEMSGWLLDHGPILWEEVTTNQVSPDEYERWIDDGGRVAGGLDEAGDEVGRAASDCG